MLTELMLARPETAHSTRGFQATVSHGPPLVPPENLSPCMSCLGTLQPEKSA